MQQECETSNLTRSRETDAPLVGESKGAAHIRRPLLSGTQKCHCQVRCRVPRHPCRCLQCKCVSGLVARPIFCTESLCPKRAALRPRSHAQVLASTLPSGRISESGYVTTDFCKMADGSVPHGDHFAPGFSNCGDARGLPSCSVCRCNLFLTF